MGTWKAVLEGRSQSHGLRRAARWWTPLSGALLVPCALACSACSPSPASPAPTRAAPGRHEILVSAAPTSSATDVANDAKIEGWIAEFRASDDVFSAAIAHAQSRPPGFSATFLRGHTQGSFPGITFTRVRGFVYWQDPIGPHEGFSRSTCHSGPVTKEGTLCPSTQLPGVELDPAAVADLLAAANDKVLDEVPLDAPWEVPGPLHGVVFYDARDSPVAVLRVDLTNRALDTFPDLGRSKRRSRRVSSRFHERYAELCARLRLPLCFIWEWDLQTRERVVELLRRRPEKSQRSPLEAFADRPLDAFDVVEPRRSRRSTHLCSTRVGRACGAAASGVAGVTA
jgi:hypothetical protein